MKWLIALLVLGGTGYVVYAYVWNTPPRRACAKMADLCGKTGGDSKGCNDYFAELDKVGPAEVARVTACVNEATSCAQAVGCQAGGAAKIGVDIAKDFLDGLGKSLK